MLLLGISTNCSGEVGWLVGGFSGRVGSGIYVVKRISFYKACIVLTIELDHT